ncbi:MAG TPA: ABC transporter permease [Methanomassiliicoccales archaeon]|jgi:ABC-2 type transport system permease protein
MKNRVLIDFVATGKMFFRNKGGVFWTLAFPVFLIFIFGAIFANSGAPSNYTIYVQDNTATLEGQNSTGYQQVILPLQSTGVVSVVNVSTHQDLDQYIKNNSLSNVLVIPANFSLAPIPGTTGQVLLRVDPTSGSARVVQSLVSSLADATNLHIANGTQIMSVGSGQINQKGLSYIDFFLPGIMGMTIMTTCTLYMQGLQSRFRSTGIFRKLATTPFTRMEWLLSHVLWYTVVCFMSIAAIMIVGMLAFNVHMTLTIEAVALIVVGAAMFTGLGMLLSRFAKDEETANAAASAVTFPMMFLSGSFFPLEQMPSYLQEVSKVLPLTYLNNGLRDTMVYANSSSAIGNLAVISVIALAFILLGAYISKWKEE